MLRFITIVISLTLSSAAIAEQFSITCERQPDLHYVTFDTETKRVVYESSGATILKGEIISLSGDGVTFDLIKIGGPKYDLIWRKAEGSLTVKGLADNPERPTIVMKCSVTNLRNILPFYDGIAPMK